MKRSVALLLILLLVWTLPANAQVVLTGNFGSDAELLSYGEGEDGGYSEALLIDAGVLITTGREPIEAGRNDTLDAMLDSAFSDAYDIFVVEMYPVAGYPAERVRFSLGGNEDTRIVDLIYIPTDVWIFYAEISVPADWQADYADLVETWVESIDLFDDGLDAVEGGGNGGTEETVEASPLTWEELESYVILTDEDDTVDDLVNMFAPTWFTWTTDEQTGAPLLTLVCEDGSLVLEPEAAEALNPAQGEEGAPDLPDTVLEGGCEFVEVVWTGEGFPLYPLRGIYVGDDMTLVAESYADETTTNITDLGPEYDECAAYSAFSDELGMEAVLTYCGVEGKIAAIRLSRRDIAAE